MLKFKFNGTVLCIVTLTLALALTGCSDYKGQSGREIVSYTEKLNNTVESLQDAVVPLMQSLSEQGIVDSDTVEKVTKVSGEIDTVQNDIKAATDGMADHQYEDGTVGLLATIRDVNRWTSAFNPFSGTVDAILLALTGIATVVAGRKSKQVKTVTKEKEQAEYDKWTVQNELDMAGHSLDDAESELQETRTALKETIQGVQKAKENINNDSGALSVLKESLREKQKTPATAATIARIKATL